MEDEQLFLPGFETEYQLQSVKDVKHVKEDVKPNDENNETNVNQNDQTTQTEFRAAYLAQVRATPGIVAELVSGETLDEIKASLERAREVYNRIANEIANRQYLPALVPVPVGGNPRHNFNFETNALAQLDAVSKIAYGISKRQSSSL